MWQEKRIEEDPENETVIFQSGYTRYIDDGKVWFCKVMKRGLCVEDYAGSKRKALRLARRAWRRTKDKQDQETYGYPRVCGAIIKEESEHTALN